MARRKKDEESVSVDEVREEMTVDEAEESPPTDEGEAETEDAEDAEGVEDAPDDEIEPGGEVSDPGDSTKVIADTVMLRCKLEDSDLVEYGKAMIEALDEAKIAKSRLKGYQAECKEEEEKAMQRFEEAKALVRSEHEERLVPCEQIHNYTRGKVYTRRLDTGEVVQQRNMNPWKRQSDIDDVTSGQVEPEAEEAAEAQADPDATEENAEAEETEIEA